MTKMVVRLPEGLARCVREEAESEDMLPTEWIRTLLRKFFQDSAGEAE
jgi:hypothetical protein